MEERGLTSDEELKPCIFCGCDDVRRDSSYVYGYMLVCQWCEFAVSFPRNIRKQRQEKDWKEVASLWNSLQTDAPYTEEENE